jgi:lipopolysaccharide transport system ATP-binding protein
VDTVIDFNAVSKSFVLQHNARSIQERVTGIFGPRQPPELFWAVRDVNFQVLRGQSLGLVGHNGAGKSTILKLITRILEPTSGTVYTKGRIAALLELGSGFHPDLSGRENVFLYGSLMGLTRREMAAKLDEIVAFADIGPFIDTEIKHYSSGMYTRLAFAAATAVDPDILITDEVLAVGDEAFQRKCMDRIYGFRKAGKTIIFVSHALEIVRTLCDVAVWLDHGEMQAKGPASDVIDAYLRHVNRNEQERLAEERARKIEQADAETEAAPPVEENPFRVGSREIEITKIELLDAHEHEQVVFETNAPLIIRMHYTAHEPIRRPVFGVGLHHENNFWLCGPNSHVGGLTLPLVEGDGYIDYRITALPLLAGRYQLSVSIYDEYLMHPYDAHDRLYRLVVHNNDGAARFGVFDLPGQWHWQEQHP